MRQNETIVVGTDFSPSASCALRVAMQTANAFGARKLEVVHVVRTSPALRLIAPAIPEARFAAMHGRALEDAKRALDAQELGSDRIGIGREVRLGIPARELARVVDETCARLLVVGRHGPSVVGRLGLGSVATSVIRVARCPVLVVGPDHDADTFDRVLAAVDMSAISARVLDEAVSFARASGGGVRVLSLFEHPLVVSHEDEVVPRYYSTRDLETLEGERASAVRALVRGVACEGVPVEIDTMSKAPPATVILDVASMTGTNLIVVGTSGHNAWHRMILGSTATRVVTEAKCPVLVVPHDVPAYAGEESHADAPVPAAEPSLG